MTAVEPRRWSFSALDDYMGCGEKFRLRRIERVPHAVYFNAVAGTAFHEWSAEYEFTGSTGSGLFELEWPHYLDSAIRQSEERDDVPLERMRISGRKTAATPNKEDYEHWRDVLGPDLCEKYLAWREGKVIATNLPPDPNGRTVGIEYELAFTIGTTKIRAFVDRIYEYRDDSLLVVDVKAGARKQTTVQLPTYVLGAKQSGVPARFGSLYYARKGKHTDPEDFASWDERRLSFLYEQAAAMEAQGFYLPRPSEDCGWCSVKDHCQFALR